MGKMIGFMLDKPHYRKTILCRLGLHKALPYVFYRDEKGRDYFICSRCGERYRIT